MNRIIGITFSLIVFLAAAYAFSPRPAPASPPTASKINTLLLLDAALAGNRIVAVGERGQIFVSADSGKTWTQAKSPTRATLTAVYFHDEKHGWAVGHDAVILRSEDSGETWQQTHSAPQEEKPLLDVWFSDARNGFATGAYGAFYETADGGKTWQARKILKDDMHINSLAGGQDGKLFIAGEAGTLYRSNDGGKTWEQVASPYKGSFFGVLKLRDGSLLIFGLRGHVFRSENFGDSWNRIESATQSSLMGGAVLQDGLVILAGHDGTLLVSRDEGRSFSFRKHPESKAFASVASSRESDLLLFGEGGVSRAALTQ